LLRVYYWPTPIDIIKFKKQKHSKKKMQKNLIGPWQAAFQPFLAAACTIHVQ
jgi:hypothetical protein